MPAAVSLVEANSLQVSEEGYELKVRLQWYRSLPLSSVEKFQLAIDGEPVEPERIRFGINDHNYRLQELQEIVEEFWFILDPAVIRVSQPGKIAAGEAHQVEAELALRFPYIAIGPGKFLVETTAYTGTQVAR